MHDVNLLGIEESDEAYHKTARPEGEVRIAEGGTTRTPGTPSFDDVAAGDELPVHRTRLSRGDLVNYAGVAGEANPIHWDEDIAKLAGLALTGALAVLSSSAVASANPATSMQTIESSAAQLCGHQRTNYDTDLHRGEFHDAAVAVATNQCDQGLIGTQFPCGRSGMTTPTPAMDWVRPRIGMSRSLPCVVHTMPRGDN
jgi:MaoC dehydratase-like protein